MTNHHRRLGGKVLQASELGWPSPSCPKKEVLIAMLLSAMQGPIRGLVYTLSAVLTKFVRVIGGHSGQDEKEKGTCQHRGNCRRKN